MNDVINGLDERITSLAFAIAMLAAWQVGAWMGYRLLMKGHPKPSKFDDASMALVGLLIAFSFGTSVAKHDQRRLAVVADGNAISDFYTCAGLLKEPVRGQLRSVIQQYAQLRLDLAHARVDTAATLEDALAKFDTMHGRMAELVDQAVTDGTPIAVSLTNTLNAVSSNQASRLDAITDRLPASIVILLFASAIVTTLLIGREQGSADNREPIGTLCFIVLVTLAVLVILDLNQPGHGLIQVSQAPIERTLHLMQK